METKQTGYKSKQYEFPTKRYCQTLDLKNDPELIEKYILCHDKTTNWKEIREGIRSVGILEMELYIHKNKLFMIVETPVDFDWDTAFDKLSGLPRQAEWEKYMSVFQIAESGSSSAEKWQLMDRFFYLYEDN